MNLEVGNHYDDDSDESVSIWSVIVYTCSCYFDDYILWINSKDVKEAIFENLLNKVQDCIVFNRGTAIHHCCQPCLKDLTFCNQHATLLILLNSRVEDHKCITDKCMSFPTYVVDKMSLDLHCISKKFTIT